MGSAGKRQSAGCRHEKANVAGRTLAVGRGTVHDASRMQAAPLKCRRFSGALPRTANFFPPMQLHRRQILFLLSLLFAFAPGRAQVVWVASPWEHVLKSSAPGKGAAIALQAAANEYESCRIVVRAGAQPLPDVEVAVSALRGGKGEIPARHLTLFREHYLNIFAPSVKSTAPTGWYPDALIPFVDPSTGARPRGGKYVAAPYTVEPDANQGYWIDVHVPKGTAPGDYTGRITVTTAGRRLAEIPLKLTVWPFQLPDEFALESNFGNLQGLARYHKLEANSPELAALEDLYIDTLLAHRAVPGSLGNVWPTILPDGSVDDSRTGARLRRMIEEKHVNALRLPFTDTNDPEKCKRNLHALAEYLRGKGWLDLAYVYMKDEPNDAAAYDLVRHQGALIRAAHPGLKRMVTEQTLTSKPEWGDLYGAVDIWCPLWTLWDETTARERQALGEKMWSYTALVQGKAPYWEIDFAPVHFRSPFWVSWRYGIKGFLYWSSIHWNYPDVWNKPHFRDKYWGEGMLLYPGGEAGVKGPVPSIRLKLVREAIEDFEYMALAARRGRKAKVDAIVGRLTRSFKDWEANPQAYADGRAELARLIARP